MFVVPAAMPATMPGDPEALTVPTAVLLLAHVPPVMDGVSDVADPTQTDDVPERVGLGFTLMVLVTEQAPML